MAVVVAVAVGGASVESPRICKESPEESPPLPRYANEPNNANEPELMGGIANFPTIGDGVGG